MGLTIPGLRHGRKWQCSDIQIQRQVVRSISAFLESISIRPETLHHPDLKETIFDVVSALVWILEHTNSTTLGITVDAAVKLVSVLPDSILKCYVLDLVSPCSSLIQYHQIEAAMLCAKALNLTLPSVSTKNEKAVWDILKNKEIVRYAISYVQSISVGTQPIEYFQPMASLLGTILRRWPQSRFPVWGNANLIRMLNDVLVNPDSCCRVECLRFLSAIALCSFGATKLLENGEPLLEAVVQCMGRSQPHSVQVEAFKLARYLAINEERFSKMMNLCCERIVQAIIFGMSRARMKSGEISSAEMFVALEACHLALVTRWGGEHHVLFWKHGIGNVLLDILLVNSCNQLDQNSVSLEKQYSVALAGRNSDNLLVLRNYVWDILGWLAIHCKKGFNPEGDRQKLSVDTLILSACSASMDGIHKRSKICQINADDTLQSESATRAVLMMIYSPCEYIRSKARSVLTEMLKRNGRHILKHFLSTLKYMSSKNSFDRRQVNIYVMALACYIGLPECRSWVVEFSGLKVLLSLVRWCLSNGVDSEKLSSYHFSHYSFCGKTCCDLYTEDWEGKDILLFYSVWGLAELIKHLEQMKKSLEIYSDGMQYSVPELVESLLDICTKISTPGVRWFASYALSSLGLYGFPSKLSQRFGKVLSDMNFADTRLILKSGEHMSAHGVILAIRCPSLLRFGDKTHDSLVPSSTGMSEECWSEIRLSGSVDHKVLLKFLDFVYFGYLQAEEEQHTRLLKALAKYCTLSPLLQTLCQRRPNWGAPFPSCDLSLALGSLGHRFSDVILETKTTELPSWKCDFCTSSVPHMHVHKVILASTCDYLCALFNSGMQESLSQTIKLDLSWEAMVKLMAWFYTDKLPNPTSGCLWENLSVEEKFVELEPYLELCSVAKSWLLDDVEEACSSVITSRLESERRLSVKIIRTAFGLSLWELVEAALTYAAPSYRQLCDSGELENLDEALVDMIRSASVRYTQEGIYN